MSGYIGYSMSVRAARAYDEGEKPLSKWTKTSILNDINETDVPHNFDQNLLKKLPVSVLKDYFLVCTSWHHTSMHYNKTYFYRVSSIKVENLTDDIINDLIAQHENAHKEAPQPNIELRRCKYLTWSGSWKHPRATEFVELCEVRGGWAYTLNGKKSITANGFVFLD